MANDHETVIGDVVIKTKKRYPKQPEAPINVTQEILCGISEELIRNHIRTEFRDTINSNFNTRLEDFENHFQDLMNNISKFQDTLIESTVKQLDQIDQRIALFEDRIIRGPQILQGTPENPNDPLRKRTDLGLSSVTIRKVNEAV